MKKLLEWMGILRKPEPVPELPKKQYRPMRLSVLLTDGTIIVHYGGSYDLLDGGALELYAGPYEDRRGTCALYAPGTWISFSAGKRAIQNRNTRRIAARKPAKGTK